MVRFVLSLGIGAAGVGLLSVLSGIPIREFGLGNTLILAGATILSAGLVVIALAMVLRVLDRLAGEFQATGLPELRGSGQAADRQPATMPEDATAAPPIADEWPRPAPAREEPAYPERAETPRAPPPWSGRREEDVREAPRPQAPRPQAPSFRPPGAPPPRAEREAVPRARPPVRTERPREPFGAPPRPAPEPERMREPGELGAGQAAPRQQGSVDAPPEPPPAREKRRMFGFTRRSKARREETEAFGDHAGEAAPGGPDFSAESGRSDGPMDAWEPPRAASRPEPPVEPPPVARTAPRHGQEMRAAPPEVLKSGTIDGMSYTLYTDGSIDAEFPEGRIRFSSIEELRRHLEALGSG